MNERWALSCIHVQLPDPPQNSPGGGGEFGLRRLGKQSGVDNPPQSFGSVGSERFHVGASVNATRDCQLPDTHTLGWLRADLGPVRCVFAFGCARLLCINRVPNKAANVYVFRRSCARLLSIHRVPNKAANICFLAWLCSATLLTQPLVFRWVDVGDSAQPLLASRSPSLFGLKCPPGRPSSETIDPCG